MTEHTERTLYWELVAASLETFLGQDRPTARKLTGTVRQRFEANPDADEFWYHDEPVNLAQDILGKRIHWTEPKPQLYLKLRDGMERESSTLAAVPLPDLRGAATVNGEAVRVKA